MYLNEFEKPYYITHSFNLKLLMSAHVCQAPANVPCSRARFSCPRPSLPPSLRPAPTDSGTLEMSTMEFTCSRSFRCFSRTWRNLWEVGGQFSYMPGP